MDFEEGEAWSFRDWCFNGIVFFIIAGWAFLLYDGWTTVHAAWNDESGAIAYRLYAYSMGDTPSTSEMFELAWNDPAQREAYLNNFTVAFWQSRLTFYGIPTVILALIAILIRPKGV